MHSIKTVAIFVVICFFTFSLSRRFIPQSPQWLDPNSGPTISAPPKQPLERWYILPAAVRREEGSAELPLMNYEVRPAWGILAVLYVVAFETIFGDGWMAYKLSVALHAFQEALTLPRFVWAFYLVIAYCICRSLAPTNVSSGDGNPQSPVPSA